jgi:hypothetical protein
MIVFDQPQRTTRRTRRIPPVAALVHAPGPVQVVDRLLDLAASSPSSVEPLRGGLGNQARTGRRQAGTPPRPR